MTNEYDFLVFIGRFQPFHNGHLAVIRTALQSSKHVIILCGSAHQPRNLRNPWRFDEREAMIRACFSEAENKRLLIAPLMDVLYNDALWVRNVQETVQGLVTSHHPRLHIAPRIGLIGHHKDSTGYYLKMFPQWGAVSVDNHEGLNATQCRETLFSDADIDMLHLDHAVPAGVRDYLIGFMTTSVCQELRAEYQFITAYRKSWDAAPYPPTFITVDAVVVQSGHVLLVERRAQPGRGLWALPGGFVQPNESLLDACLRELREETRLKVPVPVLKGSIRKHEIFDEPHRSMRGRTITTAWHIELQPDDNLPKVKGADDARHAFWLPLSALDPEKMFEDHYFIIQHMVGMV